MTATVRDLMTRTVVTLDPQQELTRGDELMKRGRLRHLPVVSGGKLLGLLTHRDLLRAQVAALAHYTDSDRTTLTTITARDFMTTNVLTIEPDATAADCARTMLRHKIGCFPVVENEKLVGIITEADFVKWSLETGHYDGA